MADPTARLEPFILLARSQKGAAIAKIAADATGAAGVYVFSELLQLQSVKELQGDPIHAKAHLLLQLFAYGTLQTYRASPESYPPLSPTQLVKLKHLTLVSLALTHRSLPYDLLSTSLELTSERELEDLIIDTIYAGLLRGKMHHHEKVLHVDWAAGRDVSPDDIPRLSGILNDWCTNAASILQALDQRIASVRSESHSHASALEAFKEFRNSEYIRLASERAENKAGGGKGKGNKGDNRAFESTLPLYNSIPSEFGGESGKGGSAGGAVLGGGSGSGSGAGSGADAGRFQGTGQTLGKADNNVGSGAGGSGSGSSGSAAGSAPQWPTLSPLVPSAAGGNTDGRRGNKRPRD